MACVCDRCGAPVDCDLTLPAPEHDDESQLCAACYDEIESRDARERDGQREMVHGD